MSSNSDALNSSIKHSELSPEAAVIGKLGATNQFQMLWSSISWQQAKCSPVRSSSSCTQSHLNSDSAVHSSSFTSLTPITSTQCQPFISPQSVSSYFVTSSLSQPDSPTCLDEFHELTSRIAPTDNLGKSVSKTNTYSNRGQQKSTSRCIGGSFTIDAILGLEDLAASLKKKGSNNSRHHGLSCQDSNKKRTSTNHSLTHVPGMIDGTTPSGSSSSASQTSMESSPRSKRVRTIFSAEQLEKLEAEFARQQYMVGPERLVLAASLRLTESQVKVWFQNRRIKWRKQHLETRQIQFSNWQHEEHMLPHAFSQMFPTEEIDDVLESLSD